MTSILDPVRCTTATWIWLDPDFGQAITLTGFAVVGLGISAAPHRYAPHRFGPLVIAGSVWA